MSAPREPLGALQRWFQEVVTHSAGIEAGEALAGPISERVRPSSRLAPAARLRVYANAYVARLVECLEAQYPALRRALGAEGFESFARAYLEDHPPRHWSLDRLGAELASFLASSRPARASDEPDWADMLAELADFEWTVLSVFDGPGIERREVLSAAELGAIEPERFAECRLELAPSLALRTYRFPLNDYYARLRTAPEGEPVPLPAPGAEHLAFHRLRYRVCRYPLAPDEHALLDALRAGATVGEAIERALAGSEGEAGELGARISAWFERFTREAFFVALLWTTP